MRIPIVKVADIMMGQSPDSQFVNDDYIGVPFLQGNADFTSKYPAPIHWVTHPIKKAKKNDVLISVRAPVGKTNIANDDYCIGRGLAAIRFNKNIDQSFGWYAIEYHKVQLHRLEQGTTFTAVSTDDVKQINITLPKQENEQHKIAEILTAVDDAINDTDVLIQKYKSIKKGLVQGLLTRSIDGKGNLRATQENSPNLYIKTTNGWLPKGWDVKTIEDISEYVGSGITPTGGSEVYSTEGVLFIRSQNVTFEGLLLNDVAYISEKIDKVMKRSEIFPNDVLLNITGASIGRCCVFPDGLGKANVNQHVCAIRLLRPTSYDADFLSLVLSSWIGQSQIYKLNAGGNRQGLNYEQLRSFRIPWPGEDERRNISEIHQANAKLILEEKKNLLKLQSVKRGLMQDLLSGKVRVNGLI